MKSVVNGFALPEKALKRMVAMLAALFVIAGSIGLSVSGVPKAHAALAQVDIASLVASGVNTEDLATADADRCWGSNLGTDSGTSEIDATADGPGDACWEWNNTTSTLTIADSAAADVELTSATIPVGANVTISFQGTTFSPALTLPAGNTLTISGSLTIDASATLTNLGTITLPTGGSLEGSGAVTGVIKVRYASQVAQTLDKTNATIIDSTTNTQAGVCNAPSATAISPTPNPANQAVSRGVPADKVWCDVEVKLSILETISLSVDNASIDIGTPIAGLYGGFKESSGALTAEVNTNSFNGYLLSINGITPAGGSCTAAAPVATSLCNASNKIEGNGIDSLVNSGSYSGTPWWGYRAAAGVIADDATDGICTGRAIENIPNPSQPVNRADCINPNEIGTESGNVTPGTWTPNAGAGSDDAEPDDLAGDQTTADSNKFLAAVSGDKFQGVTSSTTMVKTGSTEADVKYEHPVSVARTFFKFGAQIKASTASGEYVGKVRLTAVPGV